MKYSVGYQFLRREALIKSVTKNAEKISEIYFSFDDFPNGRNSLQGDERLFKWEVLGQQLEDLKTLSALGIKMNFLLNGNCYGKHAQSRAFFNKIGDTIDYLLANCDLTCVTTTSPFIAKFVKENFESIETRASVNMEIGTPQGMDYISDLFDSFYLKREYNRNIEKIKSAKMWCDQNHKKLYGLANSGCLNFCSVHTFHDNLVAHENEISQMDNAYQFEGQCCEYLKNNSKRERWLRLTNFIRPEDVLLYEGLFDGLKLATRINSNPAKVIDSYCKGLYSGAITELLEPNHSGSFYPSVIENNRLSDDFGKTVLNCTKKCDICGYCVNEQKNATVVLE